MGLSQKRLQSREALQQREKYAQKCEKIKKAASFETALGGRRFVIPSLLLLSGWQWRRGATARSR
jgi:hypothetical protein